MATTNTDKLRVGVVGLGKMGLLHASLLNTLSNIHLVAICDKSRLVRTIARMRVPKFILKTDISLSMSRFLALSRLEIMA
jgi:predicted dehydrogenase